MLSRAAGILAGLLLLALPVNAQESAHVRAGFVMTKIATVSGARELAVAPNGDLLVGTGGATVFIVAHADGTPAAPSPFATIDDEPVAGVALESGNFYIGGQFGVWRVAYHNGDRKARSAPVKIASVRTSGVARDHVTTTIALTQGRLFASVGSSCNICDPDLDATRATIQEMDLNGNRRQAKAIHIRNAIALAVNPATGTLWAAVAGQDELPHGHPFEIFDAVSAHAGTVDYGWPYCYENRKPAQPGHDCSKAAIPRAVFPAYETPIGAAFYPPSPKGRFAFPRAYWGGAFVTLHGSWHQPPVPPRVVFVAMRGDDPVRGVDWNNPDVQWSEFVGGYQLPGGSRTGRPTGIAVGPQGDLFLADDENGAIYRIRPAK